MDLSETVSLRNKIIGLISGRKLHDAFSTLRTMLSGDTAWEFTEELERIETSYKYMIQYFIAGTVDEQQSRILNGIMESLYTLTDKAYNQIATKNSGEQYFLTKKFTLRNLDNIVESYYKSKSELELYREVENGNLSQIINLSRNVESGESRLFDYFWTDFPLNTVDLSQLERLFADESVPSHTKILLIAALYLSGCQFYQESIVAFLLSLRMSAASSEVVITSLCCALILMYKYSYRIDNSDKIKNIISTLAVDETFTSDVRTIYFLLTRSRDTEKLTKRVQNEIMPEIMRISPTIINKFKDTQYINDISDIEANPEWKNIMDSSGLTKKIEELNEIQMSGGDVFMGTFSKLKSFPFFSKISNWFVPFHDGNSVVLSSFTEKENLLKSILMNIKYLCNSDKYSFCLSLNSIPQSQREMMMSQFDAQNAAVREMQKSALPDPAKNREDIANRFIQDLFRFSKLSKYRTEFYDPFSTMLDLKTVNTLSPILNHEDILMIVGEYFMKNEHYEEAIECFGRIMTADGDFQPSIIQKVGFCHQCLKHYEDAIDAYLKYELFNPDDLWNLTHIASCYRSMHKPEKSLEYYRRAETVNPEKLSISLNIGHCLLDMGRTEDALKSYYKVDYLDKSKRRALRPIAWCALLLGNYETCRAYYDKVLADNPTAHDYLNVGHLNLCLGDYPAAIDSYKLSVAAFGGDFGTFLQNFSNDIEYLNMKGLKQGNIDLVLDKIAYDLQV